MDDLLYRDEVYSIIGAAVEVHRELGKGFLVPVCQESLEIELANRKVPFISQGRLVLFYKDVQLN